MRFKTGIPCTRGLSCVTEDYVGGHIIATPHIIFNPNYSIEQLDAIKVKDPKLYEDLMSDYYYKIEKETATGNKTVETFYKN